MSTGGKNCHCFTACIFFGFCMHHTLSVSPQQERLKLKRDPTDALQHCSKCEMCKAKEMQHNPSAMENRTSASAFSPTSKIRLQSFCLLKAMIRSAVRKSSAIQECTQVPSHSGTLKLMKPRRQSLKCKTFPLNPLWNLRKVIPANPMNKDGL